MKFTIIVIILFILAGCAMITRGPIQEVEFTSNTDSVMVYVNNKNIGQTPALVELWKIKKNHATFYLPDGQEHQYTLKTHINRAILNNGVFLLVDPRLGIGTFAFDYLIGSGRSFNEETLNFKHKETGKLMTIDITTKIEEPETYALVSGGMGIGFVTANGESQVSYFPELFIEAVRSYRDRYHLGFGVNFQGKRIIDEDDEFTIFPYYFLFKFAPFNRDEIMRIYIVQHIGGGWSWGKYMGSDRWGPNLFYGAGGFGFIQHPRHGHQRIVLAVPLGDVGGR